MDALYEMLNRIGYSHPLHPPMTVIPMGLVIGALIFSLMAFLPRFGKYATTARHCLTLGLAGVFPTVALGYMDWRHFYGGHLIFPIEMKMILAAVLTLLLLLGVVLYGKLPNQDKRIFAVQVLCFGTVVGIGYFGGNLVFGGSEPVRAAAASAPAAASGAGDLVYADVAPILKQSCTGCHSGGDAPLGLHLDSYDGIMAGSKYGPVVVAGKPDESELVKRIRGESTPRMPYKKPPLAPDAIQRLAAWVQDGARK
jgi:mono/diheme cytochrome c family protein